MRTFAHLARLATALCLLVSLALAADGATAPAAGAATDPNAGVVLDPMRTEVWTTEKGVKYHTKDCPNAKVKTTLGDAVVDGDTPCATCKPPVYDAAKITVFTTASGKKYHLFDCRIIAGKTSTKISLPDAIAGGYDACGVCHPPVVWSATGPATAAPAK
jgi:hypothetical protein